jgi:modification methylase
MRSRRRTTLLLGDALEQMQRLPSASVDLVLTSPPYNLASATCINPGGGWQTPLLQTGYPAAADNLPRATYVRWQHAVLRECWRLLSPRGAVFYVHKPRVQGGLLDTPLDLNPGLPLRQIVIWHRVHRFNCGPGHYAPAHEWIVVFAKPGFVLRDQSASQIGDVWTIQPDWGNAHPAPFPLELARRVLETTPDGTVLDCFLGSGTTGVAAAELARPFIGIEKDPEFLEMAKKRIALTAGRRTVQVRTLSPIRDAGAAPVQPARTKNPLKPATRQKDRTKRGPGTGEDVPLRTITFRCPPALHEALRRLAFVDRTSIQQIIEDAVADHLARRDLAEPRTPLLAAE